MFLTFNVFAIVDKLFKLMDEANEEESKEDPYLKKMFSIIAQIPKGVRPAVFKSIPSIKNPNEIHKYHEDIIVSSSQDEFRRVWEANQLTEKMTKLKELEALSPKEPAWRPTTGKCEANQVIAEALLHFKEDLENYYDSLKEESSCLKSYVQNFHEDTEHQLAEIRSLEEMQKNGNEID